MTIRRFISSLVAGALMTAVASLPADAAVHVYVNIPPPPLVVETRTVAPGPHHVWVAGYHRWDGGAYVWVPGHWSVPPHHYTVWVAGHWAHNHHGWYWREGHWR